MAISPPSDILLDVATAADPAKVQAATARLAQLAANPTAPNTGFLDALARAKTAPAVAMTASSTRSTSTAGAPAARMANAHAKTSAYQKFEAVLLQSFVEGMLPKDDELFGDKNSAGVYRSMMAEQLANQMASAGGIGVAKAIEGAHPASGRKPAAPVPTES